MPGSLSSDTIEKLLGALLLERSHAISRDQQLTDILTEFGDVKTRLKAIEDGLAIRKEADKDKTETRRYNWGQIVFFIGALMQALVVLFHK